MGHAMIRRCDDPTEPLRSREHRCRYADETRVSVHTASEVRERVLVPTYLIDLATKDYVQIMYSICDMTRGWQDVPYMY